MSECTAQAGGPAIALPASAPLIRITAGVGSPGQKTWNLRRPVTLVGSRRPASLVLHGGDISKAHCVIVNTGREVLLKDLHTSGGTLCNDKPVDLTILQDGDVITIGNTNMQVAIRAARDESDDSGCGLVFVEPTKLANPTTLRFVHTDKVWHVEDAVSLIGRHEAAPIRIDHESVCARHAVLFRFCDGLAVYDLGSKGEMQVNGEQASLARLEEADQLRLGACLLSVGSGDTSTFDITATDSESTSKFDPLVSADPELSTSSTADSEDAVNTLSKMESELDSLERNLDASWERLNDTELRLRLDADALRKQESNLAAREEELDARDAALRGQLHDLTRYYEKIDSGERQLAEELAKMQRERDTLTSAQAAVREREAQYQQKADELKRREHVLAQRWTRVLSATCPHCAKPVNVGQPGSSGSMK